MDKLINVSNTRAVIHVAVGIITNAKGEFLVAERPKHWLGGGFWEFPGGKLEPNEDSLTALKRELLEEVGLIINECTPLIRLRYDYPERTVILHAWKVESYNGEAQGLEGQEIAWCPAEKLKQLNMLLANRAVVLATLLPYEYLILSEFQDLTLSLEQTLQLRTVKMLKLHSDHLGKKEYINLVEQIRPVCKKFNIDLLLCYKNLDFIMEIPADGIHLRADQLHEISSRPISKDKWLSASCHSLEQMAHAEEIGVDFFELDAKRLSSDRYEQLIMCANLPTFTFEGDSNDYNFAHRSMWNGCAISDALTRHPLP